MNIKFNESARALKALEPWKELLSAKQLNRLLGASILYIQSEFQIYSGPDLAKDRAGFGSTIEEAVRDYISIYISKRLC